MPATIRIDFDVNAGGISEALKKELSNAQVLVASSNSAIEASRTASVKKGADEAIAAAKKTNDAVQKEKEKVDAYLLNLHKRSIADAEKAELAAAKTAEKEREKTEKYLLGVRMASIKAATAAEEKAEKERESKKHEGAGSRVLHGAESGLGFGLAIEGLKVIKEKSEEAAHAQEGLAAGTGLAGKELEQQSKTAEELGHKYAMSGEMAIGLEGHISSATHATGAELDKQTEAVIAYASAHRKAGQSVEESLGKAQKMMDKETGMATIMAESTLNIAKAQKAAHTPAANLERIQNTLTETIGKVALTVLDALQPAIEAVTPILGVVGDLIESVVKPALATLAPVMKLVAETFTQLAPIIVDLINTGLGILMPIISDMSEIFQSLIPPIIDVVGVILKSLNPVFKQLMPIIEEVAGIVKDILIQNSGMLVDILQNVLVPIIRDLVAPILLSLMPVFKMLADMMQSVVVPGIKIMSGVMNFLMVNVVQPLIKWLSGGLVDAINAVVAVITAAIKVVNSVVGAFKSLLGMGDDSAVAATKATVKKVNDVEKEGQEKSIEQGEVYHAEKKQKHANAAKAAAKAEKDAFTEAKNAEEQRFKEEEAKLLQRRISNHLTDAQFDKEKEKLELTHITNMKEFSQKFHKDETAATIAYLNLIINEQKKADAAIEKRTADWTAANAEMLRLFQESKDKQLAIEKEIGKKEIDLLADGITKQLALEEVRFNDEIAKYKDNEQMKDLLTQEHEKKRNDIGIKYAEQEKQRKMDSLSFLTGPFVAGFGKAMDGLNTKFFQPVLNHWISQKTFVGGILSDLTSSVLKYAENWIVQKGMAAAADLLFGATETASMAAIAAAAAPAAALTSLASFGANAVPANAAIASTSAIAQIASKGFRDGGFTGFGGDNQFAGAVHKNEFVLKSGSFAVDSGGNLVSVAGMGGNAGIAAAIHNQTNVLGEKMSQSTVINQRRMVLENKVAERSRSRETL